jgi:hypothetical protein
MIYLKKIDPPTGDGNIYPILIIIIFLLKGQANGNRKFR